MNHEFIAFLKKYNSLKRFKNNLVSYQKEHDPILEVVESFKIKQDYLTKTKPEFYLSSAFNWDENIEGRLYWFGLNKLWLSEINQTEE